MTQEEYEIISNQIHNLIVTALTMLQGPSGTKVPKVYAREIIEGLHIDIEGYLDDLVSNVRDIREGLVYSQTFLEGNISPLCEICGSACLDKVNRKTGVHFWGCQNWSDKAHLEKKKKKQKKAADIPKPNKYNRFVNIGK